MTFGINTTNLTNSRRIRLAHWRSVGSVGQRGRCAGAGVFGVEMFVVEGGELMLNEVAPRPHNSGHYTIEACAVSQFEQHLRAVLGLPLGDPSLKVGSRCASCSSAPYCRVQHCQVDLPQKNDLMYE